MFGLGVQELLIILAILLLIFGPRKLPQLGQAVGRTIKSFKKGMHEADQDGDSSSQEPRLPDSRP